MQLGPGLFPAVASRQHRHSGHGHSSGPTLDPRSLLRPWSPGKSWSSSAECAAVKASACAGQTGLANERCEWHLKIQTSSLPGEGGSQGLGRGAAATVAPNNRAIALPLLQSPKVSPCPLGAIHPPPHPWLERLSFCDSPSGVFFPCSRSHASGLHWELALKSPT